MAFDLFRKVKEELTERIYLYFNEINEERIVLSKKKGFLLKLVVKDLAVETYY